MQSPAFSDHHQLPDSIQALDIHLNALRGKQADLLCHLQQINTEISAAECKRGSIHNNLAPISMLPPELLSQILLICQEEYPSTHIIAARVCNRWRSVVNSTKLLWANISIHLNHPITIPLRLLQFETHLNRSNPSPFTVQISVYGRNLDFSPVIELLVTHISRCSRLYISTINHNTAYSLLRQYFEALIAPRLTSLAMHLESNDSDDSLEIIQDATWNNSIFKGGAPLLKTLLLYGKAAALRPPVSREITTLDLDGSLMSELSVPDYRAILSATPCLVNLSLSNVDMIESNQGQDVLQLPGLRSLRLRPAVGNHDGATIPLLNALPLSQLETLVLTKVNDIGLLIFPNVTNLSIHDCGFDVRQIGQCMVAFPSVATLTIEDGSLLYMALSIEGNPIWWPKLQTLHVRELAGDEADTLLKMVRGRRGMKHPLQLVCLDSSSRKRAQRILTELEDLTNVGRIGNSLEPWPRGAGINGEYDGFWDSY